MNTYRIAAIPGDGIGAEVVSAGVEVLQALAKREGRFQFKIDHFDWGGEYYKKNGRMMPENGRSLIRNHDAILFGSAGHPEIPDHITLWGLRLAICQPFDQYANVRPTRVLPGITSPLRSVKDKELDWVIVRENSEGEYAGVGGRVHQGSPLEAATDVAMFTRAGVERIMRFAFRLAQSRPRKLLTVVTKSNAQRHAMVMWDERRGRDRFRVQGCDMGQDAGRCHDNAHGHEAADDRYRRGDESACRYSVRSRRGAGRLARYRTDRQSQPRAQISLDVRTDPRLGFRHHG